MLGVNCRSKSSSCISPSHMSYSNATDNETANSVLNMSPRLSSKLNPFGCMTQIFRLERAYWDSEEMKNSNAIQCLPNSTPNHKSLELKKEIATLEVEIIRLERYLLSLYRKTFEDQMSTLSETRSRIKAETPSRKLEIEFNSRAAPRVKRSLLRQYQSSPARGWVGSNTQSRDSSIKTSSTKVTKRDILHLQDRKTSVSGHRSLADHLGAFSLESSFLTPDRLSEDIVKCISSIYCKLAYPTQAQQHGLSTSPTSSISSSSLFSSHNPCDSWSPCQNEDTPTPCDSNGLHTDMIEVLKLSLNDDCFKFASAMLQKFRSLVRNLENVNPSKMNREEKLAFWINIHNALVMHAYLAYGTGTRVKSSTILKAAYIIGGQCINAYVIQTSILGIRPHHSSPWPQSLFSPGRKSKPGNSSHIYALEYPEPLVHFALCSGAYSDPHVRVYRAKNIFVDLKLSKSIFIQSNVYIHKETKIFLPKILYYFAKDTTLPMPGLLETVNECISDVQRKAIKTGITGGKLEKYINWLPENSTFRYIFHGELSRGSV